MGGPTGEVVLVLIDEVELVEEVELKELD